MTNRFRICSVLGAVVLMGLSACIVAPIGDDRGGGRDHEDHERHDRGDEQRHDFGVTQKERFGFYRPYDNQGRTADWRPAVFVPEPIHGNRAGIWG